jgi:mitogen-activated protein kinase 15
MNGNPIFPGSSTINQLERILQFTGKPKKDDILSLHSDIALTLIESISTSKMKSTNEYFNNRVSSEAIDLIEKMLKLNP